MGNGIGIYEVPLHRILNLVQTLIGYFVYTLLANRKIMRFIAVTIMKMMLMKAKNDRLGKDVIIQKAYDNMIKNYEYTIMYLKANRS